MRAFLPLLALALFALPANAGYGCSTFDGTPEVTTPATGVSLSVIVGHDHGEAYPGIYYIDNDLCQPDCVFSVWIYEESNGVEGLQRAHDYYDGWNCIEPDTIIF